MPELMTKTELLSLLDGIKQSVVFGYVIYGQLEETDGFRHIADRINKLANPTLPIQAKSGVIRESLARLAEFLSTDEKALVLRGNYFLLLDFALIRYTYESIVMYCEEHECLDEFQLQQDLYQFARICRNLVSHHDGATLNQWPSSLARKGVDSVTWRDMTIASSDVGELVYLDTRRVFLLHDDLRQFVHDRL